MNLAKACNEAIRRLKEAHAEISIYYGDRDALASVIERSRELTGICEIRQPYFNCIEVPPADWLYKKLLLPYYFILMPTAS